VTDEELGRLYAAAHGHAAATREWADGRTRWDWGWPSKARGFVAVHGEAIWGAYETESEAHSALGAGVRAVLQKADAIRGALAGTDMSDAAARQDFKEWVAESIDAAYHLNNWPALDEDSLNEQFGVVADQIVDVAYSHFRFEGG
jgi:hypothetical protein